MKRFKERKKNKRMILALFWAGILVGVFSRITFTEFERFRIEIVKTTIGPVHKLVTVRIQEKFESSYRVLLLNLKIRNKETRPKTIEVSLNAARIGDLALPPAAAKEYFLEIRRENFSADEMRVDLRGKDDSWELTKFDIENVYGYSTGLVRFIITPRSAAAFRSPSWFSLLGLFFLFFLLEVLQNSPKSYLHRKRLASLLFRSFFALFACFSLLPFVSRYRILFGFSSLLSLMLILYFADRYHFSKILIFLRKFFSQEDMERSPWKKHLVSFSISALIFLLFLSILAYSLKYFRGNYSGFMCFANRFLDDRNPIFWNKSPQLIFPNSDFEKGTLENWTAPGDVFQFQPTKDDDVVAKGSHLPINNQGKYWIGVSEKNKKKEGLIPRRRRRYKSSEKLVSAPFIIQKEKIGFLISGGKSYSKGRLSKQSVALEINGEIVREDAGTNTQIMELHVWDVAHWVGQTARIMISERINVDWFHYYQDDGIKEGLLKGESGYDGQFFYYMTYDPFLSRFKDDPWKYKLMIDAPPYRYSRIGFSLLTKLFSLDRPRLYPKTMIWLILLSHFLGAFFLVRIIQFYKQNPFWAFLYILIPGFQLSLNRALPESIAAVCLLGGLYFYLKEKPLATASFFALSFLTRETGVLLALGIIFFELFRKKNLRNALLIGLSFIPLIFWRFFITLRLFGDYRWKTLFSSTNDFRFPFSGFVKLGKEILAHKYPEDLILAATVYPIVLTCIFLFSLYFFGRRKDFLSLSLFAFSLVSVLLRYEKVWIHVGNGIRVTYEAVLFLIIVFISQSESRKLIIKYPFLSLFLLIFIFFYLLPSFDPFFRKGLVSF